VHIPPTMDHCSATQGPALRIAWTRLPLIMDHKNAISMDMSNKQ
jgi:hypothetical protein